MGVSLADIGWAAGFYEGEGSFIRPGYVSITQKDPEPLYKAWRLFGGKEPKRYNGYYYWRIYGVEMRQFILTIFTLLSKRRRAQILIYKELFTTPDMCPNKHPYPPDVKMETHSTTGATYRVCPICRKINEARKIAFREATGQHSFLKWWLANKDRLTKKEIGK